MTKLWNFTRYDSYITISVLRNWNSKGQLVYKDEYAGLECPGCKRIDEMAALSKGIRLGKIRSKKLIFDSTDSFTVISSSLLKVPPFNSSTLFNVYNFTDTVDYSIIIPKILIKPALKSGFVRHLGRSCRICKRYKEILIGGHKRFRMPFPKSGPMAFAYALENNQGLNLFWYISEEILREIRSIKPKLNRLCLIPFEFLDWYKKLGTTNNGKGLFYK